MANNGNHFGGTLILTASFVQLSPVTTGMQVLSVRNGLSTNGTCELGNADGLTGILAGGDSKTYYFMRPSDIYVRGTAGNRVYWDGSM